MLRSQIQKPDEKAAVQMSFSGLGMFPGYELCLGTGLPSQELRDEGLKILLSTQDPVLLGSPGDCHVSGKTDVSPPQGA